MRKKGILLLILPVGLFLLLSRTFDKTHHVLQAADSVHAATDSHPNNFFDERSFYDGVAKTTTNHPQQQFPIRGGIIPHHLFPGFILTDFYYRLSQQHPRTIILMGPNHYEKGANHILSSLYSWETPFGMVQPNQQIIATLVKNGLVRIDETVLPNDHAVAGSMPFIKFYMPDTTVVPLLISGFTSKDEIEKIAQEIALILSDKDIVFVTPVDFSHYLTSDQAKEKDATTARILKNFAIDQLLLLDNDYLDSPPSIATLLLTMQQIHATTATLLYHTNSGDLQHNPYISTTSYFSIQYH